MIRRRPFGPYAASLLAGLMLPLDGCATLQQQQAATAGGLQGAAVGAVIGAATGAILSSPQMGPQTPMYAPGN